MNVILLEKIGKLGEIGETANVKSGYARNFLFPKVRLFLPPKIIWSISNSEKLNFLQLIMRRWQRLKSGRKK